MRAPRHRLPEGSPLRLRAGGVPQDVIVSERRFQYEADVATNPLNYDAWFDYVRLEEAAGDPERVGGIGGCMHAPQPLMIACIPARHQGLAGQQA